MRRNKNIIVLVSRREREEANLAAKLLGYPSLAAMIREGIEQKVGRARQRSESFDAVVEEIMEGERDE